TVVSLGLGFVFADEGYGCGAATGFFVLGGINLLVFVLAMLKHETEAQSVMQEMLDEVKAISEIYTSVFDIDLETGEFKEVSSVQKVHESVPNAGNFDMFKPENFKHMIKPECLDDVLKFVDFKTLDERMKGKKIISLQYLSTMLAGQPGCEEGIWTQASFIERRRDEDGHLKRVIFTTRRIHEDKLRQLERDSKLLKVHSLLKAQCGVIQSLALPFENTFAYIYKKGKAVGVSVNDEIADFLGLNTEYYDYNEKLRAYVETLVIEEDRELFEEVLPIEKALAILTKERCHSFIYRRKRGGVIEYMECLMVMADTKAKDFVVAFRNVNEEKRLAEAQQRKLDEAYVAATEANKAKTHFLFNKSHDIRTPMNAIIGFRDLLEKNQDDPVKRQDYLNKIKSADEVLLSIINNVLEMTRIEQSSVELDETVTASDQYVDAIESMFRGMMEAKGLAFDVDINVEHEFVYSDVTKTREVMVNILSNAYKYTNPGGKVSVKIEEVPAQLEGYVMYRTTVTDTGIGMGEDFVPHLFDAFSRENSTTDGKVEGTGLGMPIVKRLVDLMHGSIEVKSQKGEGTTVVVMLPHRIAESKKEHTKRGAALDYSIFVGKRILLAEDNDLNAEIATELLQDKGFSIERAENGKICCDMLKEAPAHYYDLILMDIQMPEMNGYEASVAIRQMADEEKANIPIVAMTANAFEEDKKEAFRCGMNGHLAKPINVKEVFRTLVNVLKV
ncbi:MAG: ATP-binding protein, partial [Bacteroidales bacterium]|nr:ATP-binding protein [Bacteroidales bacterium]